VGDRKTMLLSEIERLGILNIDASSDELSLEVISAAVDATRSLNERLNKNVIKNKLKKADKIVGKQQA
jgi:hypothetical protein